MNSYWKHSKFWHRLLGIKTVYYGYLPCAWQTGMFGRGGKWILLKKK
jgi:hypothetical protein